MIKGNVSPATAAPLKSRMDPMLAPMPTGDDPYRSPQAAGAGSSPQVDRQVLASRSSRLAAAVIDYLCLVGVSLPAFIGLWHAATPSPPDAYLNTVAWMFIVGLVALGALQARYLIRDGQTIGKKLMKIRIVDHVDRRVPPWPRVLGMRYLVNMALRQVPGYWLIDVLFIFGSEQRCLHDLIAGTKVVEI